MNGTEKDLQQVNLEELADECGRGEKFVNKI